MELSIGLSPELKLLVIALIAIPFLLNVYAIYSLLGHSHKSRLYILGWLVLIMLLPVAAAITYIVISHKQKTKEFGDGHS